MDQLTRFSRDSQIYTYFVLLIQGFAVLTGGWLVWNFLSHDFWVIMGSMALLAAVLPIFFVQMINALYVRPIQLLWQAILFVAPEGSGVPAPDMKQANDLVQGLIKHVYRLADMGQAIAQHSSAGDDVLAGQAQTLQQLPTPIIGLDPNGNVVLINDAALTYLTADGTKSVGEPFAGLLDLEFLNDNTLSNWLEHVRSSEVRASNSWQRVRLTTPANPKDVKFVDLVVGYFKDSPSGIEAMLVIVDHTATYSADDQALGFVTMAVHEMRTPLTVLRGYVEALHDDLTEAPAEVTSYLQRAEASGQQLASFVNNILNVSRVEDGQLVLQLAEEQWQPIVEQVVSDHQLRAQTRGITLTVKVAAGLPTVGADRVSIYQVLSNLIENAIKYSPSGSVVTVEAKMGKDGRVDTTVSDHGPGIVSSAIPQLFDKFYRDHRNKNRVSGTGLGLYLSKTFVSAHGGEIWVSSKEGQGSQFGFSLLPYSELAAERKDGNNKGITRTAHGWIKNHSIYRG